MNHGIDLGKERSEQSPDDWQFGALSTIGLATIPLEMRDKYLPKGEIQRGAEDFQDCATRSPHNQLEAQFTYLYSNGLLTKENSIWLENKGYVSAGGGDVEFSDRFTAILSGTTRQGNSLKAPLESIRKNGLIPKIKLPKGENMTWAQYHDASKITAEMKALGKEFAKRFTINYDQVNRIHFAEALKDDLVGVAAYAWPFPENGVYQKSDYTINHAFVLFNLPKFQAYDNYEESPSDFTKNLAPDYLFYDYGYRVYIASENVGDQTTVMEYIIASLQAIIASLSLYLNTQKPEIKQSDTVYDAAYKAIGKDNTPFDQVPDEVACVHHLSTILRGALKTFPIMDSTKVLFGYLEKSPSWQPISKPEKGCIILSVTDTGNGVIKHGHCGIVGKIPSSDGSLWVMSNDSRTGLWSVNYTINSWNAYYQKKGGMQTFFYRPL